MTQHPLFEGFREGILADPSGKPTPLDLTQSKKQMDPNHIAAAYQISRQLLSHHQGKLGLAPTDWLDPSVIFNALLEKSRACRLRSKLANPSTRRAIESKLHLISKISHP